VPYIRGFDPSVDCLVEVTCLDGVVGVKYALKDPIRLGEAVDTSGDDVVWVNGLAERSRSPTGRKAWRDFPLMWATFA
jgi:4-hydroxy-tetrahydrodipicolinate synthase